MIKNRNTMLRDFTPRLYQQTIFGVAAQYNTLVVLPTGMGKTGLALLCVAHRLQKYLHSKILMLAPTKPLCEQHVETFRRHLDVDESLVVLFTGSVSPTKRAALWKTARIIVSTPQGLENDIINERISFAEVSLLIFDEAHHGVGQYAYVWIAQKYLELSRNPRVLALTASPGSDMETISTVCTNLGIEKVEVRTEKDHDVVPYVQQVDLEYVSVDFPAEFKDIQKLLIEVRRRKLGELVANGFCRNVDMNKGELLGLQGELQQKIASEGLSIEGLRGISVLAEALKVEHGIELLETQGITQLQSYVDSMVVEARTSKVKATKNLVLDSGFVDAVSRIHATVSKNVLHPKLERLVFELKGGEGKAIVFTQFRNSAEIIVERLNKEGISNHIFVGQAKKNGLGFSQKQQREILDTFRLGGFRVLVATSVAEEGLDIPKVDLVLFYEPIPSAIRAIQRRGRTGRLEKGEVKVLVTKGTRDEAYRWTAHHKERRMHTQLETLRKNFSDVDVVRETRVIGREGIHLRKENRTLGEFGSPDSICNEGGTGRYEGEDRKGGDVEEYTEKIKNERDVLILADHREKNNTVAKELMVLGATVRTVQLERADYVLSGVVGVEMKKVADFVDSILDGRLLEQLLELRKGFAKVILIVEGTENVYTQRNVHPNAIRGMMATIAVDFHIPIMWSRDAADTAAILFLIAKREQGHSKELTTVDKKGHGFLDQQERFVAGLPGVGLFGARKLLSSLGSVSSVVNASALELEKIDGVGPKTAARLREFFDGKYLKKEK